MVALVGDFPSDLLGVRECDEDPDLEERWGSSGDRAPGRSTDRGFGPDGPLVGGNMARGFASMTSTAMSCSNSSVRERAGIGESGRRTIWLFFDGGPWQGVSGDGEVFQEFRMALDSRWKAMGGRRRRGGSYL